MGGRGFLQEKQWTQSPGAQPQGHARFLPSYLKRGGRCPLSLAIEITNREKFGKYLNERKTGGSALSSVETLLSLMKILFFPSAMQEQ